MRMNGFVFYDGPSVIDQKPIVVIVTGVLTGANNVKTGPMAQVYILRSDMNPLVAVQTGDDASICGNCRHRGRIVTSPEGIRKNVERSCYVTLMHGPRVVYTAFKNGAYDLVPSLKAQRLLAGKNVRVGAYGDPGAVPLGIWTTALSRVSSLTAYTHLWRQYPSLSTFCMASCDSELERDEAKALGFRTFRVRSQDDARLKGEGICPAASELGKQVQCVSCMLCGGNRVKAKADITIKAHGTGRLHFERKAREHSYA
jgi:hypothetical protein